jgi:hypothetical protein
LCEGLPCDCAESQLLTFASKHLSPLTPKPHAILSGTLHSTNLQVRPLDILVGLIILYVLTYHRLVGTAVLAVSFLEAVHFKPFCASTCRLQTLALAGSRSSSTHCPALGRLRILLIVLHTVCHHASCSAVIVSQAAARPHHISVVTPHRHSLLLPVNFNMHPRHH